MKVYFVRHGQTTANAAHVHQDSYDGLTEKGLEQAKIVAKRLKDIKFDAILSSDTVRALATAEEIAKTIGKKVEVMELLRERRRPSALVGKRFDSEEALKVVEEMERNKLQSDFHYSDEENHTEALQRSQKFLRFLENRKEETILAVTHAAFIKFILTAMIFGTDANLTQFEKIYDSFRTSNAGITLCRYEEGLRGLYKKETYWYVETWNEHSHLGEFTSAL